MNVPTAKYPLLCVNAAAKYYEINRKTDPGYE